MLNEQSHLYEDIACRTGGNIYIGVTGPVRTGKSTFVRQVMQTTVLPQIGDVYLRERANDELPQCGAGKTIMTAEPKFVPEQAIEISPGGTAKLSVRLIDSVGYMVPGAVGAEEDGQPRMVTTPWYDHPLPMAEAAELGTKKVMEEHCTVGVVVTTDGSVTDLPAAAYAEAERRAITDMRATGKPFLVLLNTKEPSAPEPRAGAEAIEAEFGVRCLPVNVQALDAAGVAALLRELLFEFPLTELRFFLPGWFEALEAEHPLKSSLYAAMRKTAEQLSRISEAEPHLRQITEQTEASSCLVTAVDLGRGTVDCRLELPQALFYGVLGEAAGVAVANDRALLRLLRESAQIRRHYARVADALEQVQATGYGVVAPCREETVLEAPELVRRGGAYGVKLRASAPSIHMLRTDVRTEISPMVGDERQSEALVEQLAGDYETDTEKLWQSNIFGKSVGELIDDGLHTKLVRLPEDARMKLQGALTRIVNEGANGLICLIL